MLFFLLVCFAVKHVYVSGYNDFQNVTEGEKPFQVSLKLRDIVNNKDNHFCSGAILNSRWVVTSARCLENKRSHKIRVVAGTVSLDYNGAWYEVEKTIIHDGNELREVANDIGLLKTKTEIEFNDRVAAISLPKSNTPAGSTCVASGWAFTDGNGHYSRVLQETNVTTLSTDECRRTELKKYFPVSQITDGEICAYKQGRGEICRGDGGLPLTKDNEIVGIGSYDVPCTVKLPNLYLRLQTLAQQ